MISVFTFGMKPLESEAANRIIDILLRHSKFQGVVLVGSVALRYHLGQRGDVLKRPFRGVDVAADAPYSAIQASILREMWLYWKNPEYIALLDVRSGANLSVYGGGFVPKVQDTLIAAHFENRLLQVVNLEFMFIRLLLECSGVLNDRIVDPKQFEDLSLVFNLLNKDNATFKYMTNLWDRAREFHPYLLHNWEKAHTEVDLSISSKPNLWVPNPYRRIAGIPVGKPLLYVQAARNARYTLSRRFDPNLGW